MEKNQSNKSNKGLLFILFVIALFLDAIEILETILDLGIVGFLLFLITTPLSLLFYALIFFSNLWPKVKANKRIIYSFLIGLIGENVPIIELLPINTLNILLIAFQENPEMFGKLGSVVETGISFANKVSLVSSAKTQSSISGFTTTTTMVRQAKLTSRATQSSTKLSSKTANVGPKISNEATPQISRKAKTASLTAAIFIILLFSFVPLVTRAQYYNQQDYYDILRPYLEIIQPFQAPPSPLVLPEKETLAPKENVIYLSVRKVPGGLMIGVEPIIFENDKQLSAEDFRYQFQITEISLQWKESWNNVFVFRTFDLPNSLTIKVTLISLKSDAVYKSQKSFIIPPPKLVLVSIDPETNLISPFDRNSRFVTVLPFYFTSEKLRYRWLIDNQVFSESPMIEFNPQKSITVEVINPYNSREKAVRLISSP